MRNFSDPNEDIDWWKVPEYVKEASFELSNYDEEDNQHMDAETFLGGSVVDYGPEYVLVEYPHYLQVEDCDLKKDTKYLSTLFGVKVSNPEAVEYYEQTLGEY